MSAQVEEPRSGELAGGPIRSEEVAPKRRSRRGRWLLGVLVAIPLAVAVLWVLVHRISWMGPLVANTLRSVIGRDNVAKLEDFVYSIEDRVNQVRKADEAPQAHWTVPPAAPTPPPPPASAAAGAEQVPAKALLAAFEPPAPGPMFPGFSAPGDGQWVPLVDKRHPEDSPRLLKTLIHPDKSRGWAELFVVAVDLRRATVELMAGYQEPRTEKKEAEGYQRPSKIPESDWGDLLGAFNGGFMAEHGHYGFALDGIVFLDPKPDSCTLARYRDGSYEVATWERIAAKQSEMTWFRQAPTCMFEDGEMHPTLKGTHQRKWGATLDGNTVIRRSAIGMNRERTILYVGISNHTTAKVLAQGMHHAGAQTVAQMDVNWSYPKFVTYEPNAQGVLTPIALADGFEFSDRLYLRERSMRDFFYLVRKDDEAPGTAAATGTAAPAAPAAPASSAAPAATDAPAPTADPAPAQPAEKR
ncbi:MAG TPA: hypothetical protein VLC09_19280 [Polyangiaceae bacterium]|nr:hypothetical protein [Polyangiaceae bacterium]